jgi:GNAT superfamily N-acetyltransferase
VSDIVIRKARREDLEAIVRLHEADELGGHGDAWSPATAPLYEAAFAAIADSGASAIYVVLDGGAAGAVIGTFQLTFAQGLTGRGKVRAFLESVQVRANQRSRGIGAKMVRFAESEARARGAATMQLTSNKKRLDAHRFYERLGYAKSHEGFKKPLV